MKPTLKIREFSKEQELHNISRHPNFDVFINTAHPLFVANGIGVLGYVPQLVLGGADTTSVVDNARTNYPYLTEMDMDGLVITDQYQWNYEGDPSMEPIAFFIGGSDALIFYPNALVYLVSDDGTESWARMD